MRPHTTRFARTFHRTRLQHHLTCRSLTHHYCPEDLQRHWSPARRDCAPAHCCRDRRPSGRKRAGQRSLSITCTAAALAMATTLFQSLAAHTECLPCRRRKTTCPLSRV